ncbi:hypothetical protein PR202_ga22633 [Eleusine coracana subsp. coracana]|uniref:DUF3615 domain-containing protein n=1 Tax=Eleusine coracana subsp. coracana TaxID=191504 RepID=A0AAV5D4I9_ELECO|nr:hypothetical protein PR202_ga22633 [Eleusine coracana subsp. coracana]
MDAGDDSNAGSRRPRITRGRRYRPSRPDPNSPAALALEEWRSDGSPPLRIPVPAYFGDQSPLDYARAITLWSEWQSARAQELARQSPVICNTLAGILLFRCASLRVSVLFIFPLILKLKGLGEERVFGRVFYIRIAPGGHGPEDHHSNQVLVYQKFLLNAISLKESSSNASIVIMLLLGIWSILVRIEEYPNEASISELGRAVTELPTLEALSLMDSPLLTTQMTGEETDDEDDDSEETLQQIQHLMDAESPCTIRELFDSLLAPEHAALTALAAEHGTEPPRDPFLVDEESQLAPHASAAAAQPLASMTTSPKASAEENIKDGKKWMRDEVKLCFKKHIEKTTYRTGLDFELDELCHQCFNVESYTKVFHHYNFKMRTKMPSSLEWTVELYFAEVKEIFGRKFYFCCPLEPNENGHCYACKNQGVEDLKHPATGGFEVGLPDAPKSSFWWCSDEDE